VEAGRWSYLQQDADEAEVDAFERAYPSPESRLLALRWPVSTGLAATAYARQRLDDLVAAAPAWLAGGANPSRWSGVGAALALILTALVSAVFVIIGAMTLVEWIF